MRTTTLWNTGWEFCFDEKCGVELPEGVSWQGVTLPHDWQIWHTGNLYQDGTGWYRKCFVWQPGQRMELCFEGVYMDCAVFVNGQQAAEWKYGYSTFYADVTDWLHPGENEILVRCRVLHPNSRWYSGAGIYRDVWRVDYPESHLVTDGLYIVPRETAPGAWSVAVSAEAVKAQAGDTLEFRLLDADGNTVCTVETVPGEAAQMAVENPALWSLEAPVCYRMEARLIRSGETLDILTSPCGFRTLELTTNDGLLLNHRRVVLHGVCLHHDLGCLGAAFNLSAARRQLEIMKDMGVNALRTSHNMPAPGMMALCDEMGILVVDEAFDYWVRSKTQYDYARFFPEWYKRDVASWVRRDRNHPSLLFWSIGNEIYDTHQGPQGKETMRLLLEEVAKHDPQKNGLTTFGSNYLGWENTQNCAGLPDAVGYNYGENLYDDHHAAHPEWVIYGSETASIVQSRGIYHFPLSQPLLVDDDLQCSSLGNSRTSWGARSHQACIESDEKYPYNLGQFLWSGIDYIGEPTPYHTKNSYFGTVDTAGFPKDAFYIYQAGWHRWQDKKVLHLLPYWDFNPGQMIDVCIISNLPQVELFVNGVSLGKQSLKGGSDVSAHWQAPYVPGEIRAVGYDDRGEIAAVETERSFGDTVRLQIEADRPVIHGNGREPVFFTISAVDAQGNPVRNAVNRVNVSVSGGLKLIGLDNGNSVDMEEYKGTSRCLFSGKLLAVAASDGCGKGRITVSSPDLEEAWAEVDITEAEEVFPILPEIQASEEKADIPVRKIELIAGSGVLTKDAPEAIIRAKILPEGAKAELTWRVTDVQGISVSNVKLEPVDAVTVRAVGVGDGNVRIRCMSGMTMSDLEMEVAGLGSLYLNPYEYTSAALFTANGGEIGNGNERGIATARQGSSWVAYDKLDFGSAGADTLTIDIFEMSNIPTPVRFWKGIPYAPGSRMIGEKLYDKPSIWNVYQPETWQLDERLTGSDVFAIELSCKVHIKGFTFLPRTRAWDCIPATEYTTIYGDTFTLQEASVDGIGNNVSLVFDGMDFGENGLGGIAIRGKSKLENNTIHVRFESPDGETARQVVEFPGSNDWQEISFPLEAVRGKQTVTFLFLPGCDFDFQSFRFLPNE